MILLAVVVASSVAQEVSEGGERAGAQASNLHQWGAVTLFHGLPSDRVRAIAQDADGVMWFGTDAGLARYDGRRTQTVAEGGLTGRRVLALRFASDGVLWIGTDAGAVVRFKSGAYRRIAETEGKAVASIALEADAKAGEALTGGGRVFLTSNAGAIFECRLSGDETLAVRVFEDRLLRGVSSDNRAALEAGADASAPLELTSAALVGQTLFVGTRGRGFLAVEEGGAVKEVYSRPRPYFVETIERDSQGRVWFGAQTTGGDSGLYESDETFEHPSKVLAGATGTVTVLRFDRSGDLFVGTDGEGVFRYRGRMRLERLTFAGTKGGLRSDHIYSIFFDREGVAWFGTDRGVCRYDPHALGNESLSEDTRDNSVRALFRTSGGRLLAGGSRGLYVREATSATTATWRAVGGLANKTVYTIAEDASGLLLVGASSGLYVGVETSRAAKPQEMSARSSTGSSDEKPASTVEEKPAAADKKTTPADKTLSSEPALTGSVRAIANFRGATYIAIYGRGVERLDKSEGRIQRTLVWPTEAGDEARGRETVSLYAEGNERLWIGTAGAGVFYFDGRAVRTDPALSPLASKTVRGITGGAGEPYWFATNRGLYLYRDGTLNEVLPNVDARAVLQIPGVTVSETNARSTSTPTQTPASTKATPSTQALPSTQATPASARASAVPAVWCATAGGGLLRVSFDEVFGAMVARLDVEQGLPSQNVFAILPVNLDETNGDGSAVRTSGDGSEASGSESTVSGDYAGGAAQALWIGTARGVSRYEPSRVSPALRATRITGARAHQPEELPDGLRLEYPQNSLVLDVAATSSRTFPEQFQYAFLLYDDAGRIIKRKLAHDSQFQIESLHPGRYRVEARAYTADLVPSNPLAFDLYVARSPFPWTTTGLSVLLALAIVALAWGSVQNARLARTGKALMEANRQLAAARLQLANETEAERRRIARDLHDQTLADLRRLLLLTDQLPAATSATGANGSNGHHQETIEPSALRSEIESISNEIRRICEDLSPSVLENVGLAAALEWAVAERVAHLPADCRFTYEFVCDDELEERLRLSPGVQMQIYRIVQEAVSNICRHAAATHVRLKVDVTGENELVLTLEDDGRGFDTDNRKAQRGRGLSNIRARAIIIQAEVGWHKRADGGTAFVLQKKIESLPQPSKAS